MLINSILRREFRCLSSFYYDDKFAFEPVGTCASSFLAAVLVHQWVGAVFNSSKLAFGDVLRVLGVQYDLPRSVICVTDDRRTKLLDSIRGIFASGKFGSGLAGKLRGQLGFAASQFWGKVGRAYFRSLSERQYDKSGRSDVTLAIELSLRSWTKILCTGRPRPIVGAINRCADVVIFTDGFFPNPRRGESGIARVGGVIFDRERSKPMWFTKPITDELMAGWIPRETQISMVEMFAPVLAVAAYGQQLAGRSLIVMVDSESVEGALVKGYSSKADLCELTGVFWDLCDQLHIAVYIDRVPTDANISDGPSRDDAEFYRMADDLGWVALNVGDVDVLNPVNSSKGLGRGDIGR